MNSLLVKFLTPRHSCFILTCLTQAPLMPFLWKTAQPSPTLITRHRGAGPAPGSSTAHSHSGAGCGCLLSPAPQGAQGKPYAPKSPNHSPGLCLRAGTEAPPLLNTDTNGESHEPKTGLLPESPTLPALCWVTGCKGTRDWFSRAIWR